jgi:hypothetical protein
VLSGNGFVSPLEEAAVLHPKRAAIVVARCTGYEDSVLVGMFVGSGVSA